MKIKAIWGRLLNILKKGNVKFNKKLLISGAAVTAVLVFALALIMQRGAEKAENELVVNDVDYAMVLQHYSGFDMSDTPTAIRFNWDNGIARLDGGDAKLKLKANIYPINLKDKSLEWRSENEAVATVDADGNITAVAPGKVRIFARLSSSGKIAAARLTVIQPVTGLFLPSTTLSLYTGGSGTLLSAMVFPENASNTTVLWESDHPEIVSVDGTGRLKPIKKGNAVITAQTEDGGFKRVCHVTVSDPSVEVSQISIQNKENRTVSAGETIQLTAIPKPSNAKNRTPLKWESSDEMIASVSQSGRVRGQSSGTAVITVSSTNGITDTIEVTVTPSDRENTLDLSNMHTAYAAEGGVTYTSYSMTLPMMAKLQMGLNPPPKIWTDSGTRNASETETIEYINPNQFYTGAYKYQFLDLSKPNGVDIDTLNNFLANKGVLSGKGEVFARAAEDYGVSEVYLIAHACLESGNGTSQLANGVEYNGRTVYNVFGIGAFDDSAVASGSRKAYNEGWTSVDAAIRGGAEWISRYYIYNSDGYQNTLYKMLWNPENPGTHQYATDIGWAVKQAINIERIFNMFPSAELSYDIPVYSGMVPPIIE